MSHILHYVIGVGSRHAFSAPVVETENVRIEFASAESVIGEQNFTDGRTPYRSFTNIALRLPVEVSPLVLLNHRADFFEGALGFAFLFLAEFP